MDIKVLDCDKDYLIEKWDKYIGIKPKEVNMTYEFFLENKSYFHLVIRKWFNTWDKKGENWYEVLPIINFINEINLLDPSGRFNDIMTPEDLMSLFTKHIGNLEEINKREYNCLHRLVKQKVETWTMKLKREYNLALIIN